MSANVWYSEVEKGLMDEIRSTVMILNDSGVEESIPSDAVFVKDPEEDLSEEQIPCVTINHLYGKYDPKRQGTLQVVNERDYENFKMTIEQRSRPFNLTYQLDFWSRYKEDLNVMTRTWLNGHFRNFNLPVIDDGGTERTCNAEQVEDFRESDSLLGGKRLFHVSISYRIWVELDNETRYTVPMVAGRQIEAEDTTGDVPPSSEPSGG